MDPKQIPSFRELMSPKHRPSFTKLMVAGGQAILDRLGLVTEAMAYPPDEPKNPRVTRPANVPGSSPIPPHRDP